MAQWGGTKEAVRGTTRRPWVWERRTRTILTLVGVAGLGLTIWSITGGAPLSDARAALAALIVYVTLCALIMRVDRARKRQERAARAEGEERRRRPRRPYSVVDEAEAVLDRVHGQGTR
jgi:peptidoglycan/LPS O-acetylase OafA/YrhL